MAGFSSITPNINVNTASEQLRTELLNTFSRLDGQLALAPYRIFTTGGPVGNTGAAETDLASYTATPGTLAKTNSSILIFAAGKTAANGNNKTLKLYLGSTVLFTSGAFAGNGIDWTFQAEIVRTGAANETAWSQFFGSATLTSKPQVTTATENLAVNQAIKFTGQGTTTGDISLYYTKFILLT